LLLTILQTLTLASYHMVLLALFPDFPLRILPLNGAPALF